jgi:hypothetical protein
MIATRPPRAVELLLDSLGAKPEFRDALLGDLAQEFSERAECDGLGAARRWYVREAIRATPHLLRSWSLGLRVRDVTHLVGVAASAWLTVLMLTLLIGGVVQGAMRALGFASAARPILHGDARIYSIGLTAAVTAGAMAGYAAAWLDREAPLVAALTTGAILACVSISAMLIGPGLALPIGYRIAAPIVVIIGGAIGGVLRVCITRSSDSDQNSLPVGRPSGS